MIGAQEDILNFLKRKKNLFYRENISIKDIIKNRIEQYGTVEPYINEAKDPKDNWEQTETVNKEGKLWDFYNTYRN